MVAGISIFRILGLCHGNVVRSSSYHQSAVLHQSLLVLTVGCLLAGVGWLQTQFDRRVDHAIVQIEGLAQLPKGIYLKPALLGYHHLGADILWLRLVQVLGNKRNAADEYEWMYHALDVITDLDPQYAYAYYAGGVVLGDLAHRTDLSNRLLRKGADANPKVWNIPFLLGYNYYFLLDDPEEGAEYLMRAASLPDRPAYLPGLATRMSAEAGNPETALVFLEARLSETQDPQLREEFVNRMKEVIIERDIQLSRARCGELSDNASSVSCKTHGPCRGEGVAPPSTGAVWRRHIG